MCKYVAKNEWLLYLPRWLQNFSVWWGLGYYYLVYFTDHGTVEIYNSENILPERNKIFIAASDYKFNDL